MKPRSNLQGCLAHLSKILRLPNAKGQSLGLLIWGLYSLNPETEGLRLPPLHLRFGVLAQVLVAVGYSPCVTRLYQDICIYNYVCHIHACIYTCIYTFEYIHKQSHTHIRTYENVCMYIYLSIDIYIYIHIDVYGLT